RRLAVLARARARKGERVTAAEHVLEDAGRRPGVPPLAVDAHAQLGVQRLHERLLDADARRPVARADVELREGVLDDLRVAPLAADAHERPARGDGDRVAAVDVDDALGDGDAALGLVAQAEEVLVGEVQLALEAAEGGVGVVVRLELDAPGARLLDLDPEHRLARRRARLEARVHALDARILLEQLEPRLEARSR